MQISKSFPQNLQLWRYSLVNHFPRTYNYGVFISKSFPHIKLQYADILLLKVSKNVP